MELYLVRHGIAAPEGGEITDELRPLTEEGIDKTERASRALLALGVCPALILTSPLVRAQQTAVIFRAALGDRPQIKVTAALAPSAGRGAIYEVLREHGELESLMLVGHQPSLGEIAGEIAWGSPRNRLELKRTGICCLDVTRVRPKPQGILCWLLTPAILRKLAKKKPSDVETGSPA
jgi:phosphohistidine phosphatase